MIRLFTSKTQQIGQKGEELAAVFLMKQGFSVIERNIHSRNGEIDIIAKKKKIYHFFEVKTGINSSYFNPADNLTKEKLWKFMRSCEYYAFKYKIKQYKIQGIVVLLPNTEKGSASIEIIDLT